MGQFSIPTHIISTTMTQSPVHQWNSTTAAHALIQSQFCHCEAPSRPHTFPASISVNLGIKCQPAAHHLLTGVSATGWSMIFTPLVIGHSACWLRCSLLFVFYLRVQLNITNPTWLKAVKVMSWCIYFDVDAKLLKLKDQSPVTCWISVSRTLCTTDCISALLLRCPLSQDEPLFILSHQRDDYFFLPLRPRQLLHPHQSMAVRAPPSIVTVSVLICEECVWGKHVKNTQQDPL